MKMITTTINVRVATNNNNDTRLEILEKIVRQYIKSTILTNKQTNKKINALTSAIADNENDTVLDFLRGVRK